MTTISVDIFGQLNYWAILVTALATFFLGGLWYSPVLFEQFWINANGYSEAQVRQMLGDLGATGFLSTFLAYLAMATVFALLLTMLGVQTLWGGLLLGLLIWLGFVASSGLTVNLFSLRPLATWLVDAGFQLVFLLVTGAVLSVWR